MLQTISWQQYFIAIAFTTAGWYLYIWLRYLRTSLSRPGISADGAPGLTPTVSSEKVPQIIGAPKRDEATYTEEGDALLFVSETPDEVSEQTLPKGPADDLLEEGQLLIDAASDTSKEAFFAMLNALLDKYQVHEEEIHLPAILPAFIQYAEGKLPFSFNDNDWPSEWPNH
jgi:hypothetical protein